MPDLGPWVLVLGALALVGIGLTLIGVRRMGVATLTHDRFTFPE
jgi:hypothetical protein